MATRLKRARSADTTSKYMDAAEALFIQFGYEGTSIRAISARAKMNLGTVVYHWGTKEALFRDVCLRRFGAIRAEQIQRLTQCEEGWRPSTSANLDCVLRALIEPPLLMPDPDTSETTRLLYGRVLTEPSEAVLRISVEIFRDASLLFRSLVQRCVPDLDEEVFHWRYNCALGAFIFAQSFGHRVAYAHGIEAGEIDWQNVADEIVAFVSAGLLRTKKEGRPKPPPETDPGSRVRIA
jgi:AcrR family transcriptional regulator